MYYIGLGGIGCRTLKDFENQLGNKSRDVFFYIDSNDSSIIDTNCYIVPGFLNGTGMLRRIGRNAISYELLTGKLQEFFSEIKESKNVELIFVVSSFGGFGGAAVSPLIDYLEAITWKELKSCKVIAFNENAFATMGFTESLLRIFQSNTYDFVSDLQDKQVSVLESTKVYASHFNPWCNFFIIDTRDITLDSFWKYVDEDESELSKYDCKERYAIKSSEPNKSVFISYSSKDQIIADRVVDTLAIHGIEAWIASRDIQPGSYAKQIIKGIRNASIFLVLVSKNSIASEQVKNEIDRAFNRLKDGIKIIPFILDDAELDEECEYYLCRQETLSGKRPPIEERIGELVQKIKETIR